MHNFFKPFTFGQYVATLTRIFGKYLREDGKDIFREKGQTNTIFSYYFNESFSNI